MVDVIGAALAAKAAGDGSRTIAVRLGRPVETVRGWLRRFAARQETVRHFFTGVLVGVGVDPAAPEGARSKFADAVQAVAGAWWALSSRWPQVGEVSCWWAAGAVTGGILLAPGWSPHAVKTINTSRP